MNTIKRKLNILKKRKIKKKLDSFFNWIKGAELVELKSCNITEKYVQLCVLVLQMKFQKVLKN